MVPAGPWGVLDALIEYLSTRRRAVTRRRASTRYRASARCRAFTRCRL